MMERVFVLSAAVLGFLGVAAGAFGAHGLQDRISAEMLAIWNTAAHYQLIHAVALLGVAWATSRFATRWATVAGWLFLVGVMIFSGSLYLLAITSLRWLGAITPIGGVAFLLGWLALAIAAVKTSIPAKPN